ncbi:hypothetical protein UCREL1_4671 [Eutypa lata UCREL1]|uniref:Uncharacterized protein n=1 Tax=Eutypa lata (strain UCR-EL1) TaxID=1287681 RepID=M7SVJ7_EUTLA|nr:hypothetical protein UCREL1_4671 [Eutypa lata UCREL1]
MTNVNDIDELIGLRGLGVNDQYDSDDDRSVAPTLADNDVISELKDTMMSMKVTIDTKDKRIYKLEIDLEHVLQAVYDEIPRHVAKMPKPYALAYTTTPPFRPATRGTPMNTVDNDDSESIVSSSAARSVHSIQTPNRHRALYTNRPTNPAVYSMTGRPIQFKNTSAISNRGYDNKSSIWGTVFTSLVISCMKTYIQKSSQVNHIIDESDVMKTYVKLVGELYSRAAYRELPPVQSTEVLFISRMFERKNKNEVPISTVTTWSVVAKHTDGAQCIPVIESIFKAAKMVPEAMVHPLSRLITAMSQPVLVETTDGPKYTIPRGTTIGTVPSGFERFCALLKKDALRSYVKHRLNGETESSAIFKMQSSMRDTEMFEQEHEGA